MLTVITSIFFTKKPFSRGGGYETNIETALFAPEGEDMVVEAATTNAQGGP